MNTETRQYWLFKSEPDSFSIEHLRRAPSATAMWDGVRNYQARNFLRAARVGDGVLFYHSSCAVPAVVGICTIAKEVYPDPTQFDPASPYFDPKSSPKAPRWDVVDVTLRSMFEVPIPLTLIKATPSLRDMRLTQTGSRLSIQPVTKVEWTTILLLANCADIPGS